MALSLPNEYDLYLIEIIRQHTPQALDPALILGDLMPLIKIWSNAHRYELKISGSIAKETGITGTTDLDIFISLDKSVRDYNTLENVYKSLGTRFRLAGYPVREQNVSIGVMHKGLKIDFVAGIKLHPLGNDHSVWKRKAQTWTKTNIDGHVKYVKESGRIFDIKAVKVWRKLRNLEFPSFYLELAVIEALKGRSIFGGSPSENFKLVMSLFVDGLLDKNISDPFNSANIVSEELKQSEKLVIKQAAIDTLAGTWNQAVW